MYKISSRMIYSMTLSDESGRPREDYKVVEILERKFFPILV